MVRTLEFPLQGTQVQSLVEELRFHMLQGAAKKKKTTKKPNYRGNNTQISEISSFSEMQIGTSVVKFN